MPSLTLTEAQDRAAAVADVSYAVDLDLDQGAENFGSVSTVRFASPQPGASTWADVKAASIASITFNGKEIDPSSVIDGRIELAELRAANELVVRATMNYSHDGSGLHRATDPADEQDYVYGQLFLDAAPSVYACFDQPDLKAPYDITVKAPTDWIVLGNGAATQTAPGEWSLATTKPLATYFVTVCAGPYVSVRDEHDGIPLGVHARASLKDALERHAADILKITRESFDYFHGLFGIRYPFGEYHQVFVPEFNAGAMENPGCVTFRDQYIFRGAATRDELLNRANTISHEMSHMWFGDLVTMKWWDDLWLNESFAEYMSHRCLVDATEYSDAWVDSSIVRKVWGYGADRAPSTHPVAGVEALDAQSALQNFDGISYSKGAAVLRQLIAYVGDEAFIAGVRAYLTDKSYGNGTLADFLAAIEAASGKPLQEWSKGWLLTASRDGIGVGVETDAEGTITRATVNREVPSDRPANRPHAFDIAGWTDGTQVIDQHVTISDDATELGDLGGSPRPAVLLPNASDLTWARVVLDEQTLAAIPDQLAQIDNDQHRAVVWSALIDGVFSGTVDPRTYLDAFAKAWPKETSSSILTKVSLYALLWLIPSFLPEQERARARGIIADSASQLLDSADPGSTEAVAAARALAASSADETLLRAWSAGNDLPAGLEDDGDFRWIVVRNLATRGLIDEAAIAEFNDKDDTLQGGLNALQCRAALPTPEAKEWAWRELTTNEKRSNYEMLHLARGFWESAPEELVAEYVPRYFTDLPAMAGRVGEDSLASVSLAAFPHVYTEETARAADEALTRTDLAPAVRRSIVDANGELREVLTSRATFPGDGSGQA